ncbi:MAG: hypothetical protein ACFCUG_07960 [Thiotrichales bacterium]
MACRSLGRARYENILEAAGFRVGATYVDDRANHGYDVERVR